MKPAFRSRTILAFSVLAVAAALEAFFGVDLPGVDVGQTETVAIALLGIALRLITREPVKF